MCCRLMCGYSITWYPRANVRPAAVTDARMGYSPLGVFDAARTWKRTVCDSSSRENSTF